jgi:DHA2 family multidrug resistance protein
VAKSSETSQWKPRVNPWVIAATVALGAFMEVLDTSVANVALPHISGNLGVSTDEGTWVLTSYLVSNAIVLPMGAWASSVIGRKRFFLLCIVIFTVASFLCGLAVSFPMLVVSRVIQGAGGGGLQPIAQAIMADSFDEKKRGLAFALYGLVTVLAPSIGPTLGGWITDSYSWRWIFYINIPVGILALVLVIRFVDDPPWMKADRSKLQNLDYAGLGLLAVAMGGMQIMLDKGEEDAWLASNFIRTFAGMFVFGMIGLIWREWRAKNPLIDVRLFKFKNFAICTLFMLMIGGIINAVTVLQPQFSQLLLGYTATVAGEALTVGAVALLLIMPFAGLAAGRFAARNLVAAGFAGFVVAFYYSSTHTTLGMSFGFSSWLRMIQVAPIPFCYVAITAAAYVGLPKEATDQISGIINFARNIGGSVLISVTGAMVTNRSLFHQARLVHDLQSGSPVYANRFAALTTAYRGVSGGGGAAAMARGELYRQMNQQASAMGYEDIYRILCWGAVVMMFCAFLLSKNKPGERTREGAG